MGMTPEWFEKAKLGIFIHWGIYAVQGTKESLGLCLSVHELCGLYETAGRIYCKKL